MKIISLSILFLLTVCILFSCKNESPKDFTPASYIAEDEQVILKNEVIRYIGKLPGKANHSNKFDTTFNEHYEKLAANHQIKLYYVDKDSGYNYFLITRIAPSIEEKYVAVGGRLLRDSAGSLIHFEEIFRTWKMPMDKLMKESEVLFSKMINKEDLSPYYTANMKDDFIIEFPSEEVYYDKEARRWISLREDPMEPYYKLKEQTERDKNRNDTSQ